MCVNLLFGGLKLHKSIGQKIIQHKLDELIVLYLGMMVLGLVKRYPIYPTNEQVVDNLYNF